MRYDAVVFDLDGTLLDTLEDLKNAVNAALRSQKLPERSIEEVCHFVGNGIVNLMKRAVPGGGEHEAFEEIMAVFRAFYAAHCEDHTAPYPGIVEMLTELKRKRIKTAVVSNKADFAVQELVPVYFKDLIQVAHGENETAGIRKKPAPDMVELALRELGCPAGRAVYVGDSDVDLDTAAGAGMDCISVSWGFRKKEFLIRHGARTIIDRPEELSELLKSNK